MFIKMECSCGAIFEYHNQSTVCIPDDVQRFIEAHKDCCKTKPVPVSPGTWFAVKDIKDVDKIISIGEEVVAYIKAKYGKI